MTRPARGAGGGRGRDESRAAGRRRRRLVEVVTAAVGAVLIGGAAVAAAGVHPPSDDHTLTAGGSVAGQNAATLTGGQAEVAPSAPGAAANAAAPGAGSPARDRRAATAARPTGPTRPDPPIRVRVDGVDIDQPVVPAGLTGDGALAMPPHPDTVGWYRWGSWPTRTSGSVLLAAHLDSRLYGVGPFARLRTTTVGATITTWSQSGQVERYRVLGVREYLKTAVPYPRLTDPDGPRRLYLLTCGGPYIPEQGGYQDTVVVTAFAQQPTTPR